MGFVLFWGVLIVRQGTINSVILSGILPFVFLTMESMVRRGSLCLSDCWHGHNSDELAELLAKQRVIYCHLLCAKLSAYAPKSV